MDNIQEALFIIDLLPSSSSVPYVPLIQGVSAVFVTNISPAAQPKTVGDFFAYW